MLTYLKNEANMTLTENGGAAYSSTFSRCLDLFATIGALRSEDERDIITRFARAYAENPDLAMKTLFYARDVRGGLGERRVFRVILRWLAEREQESIRKNIALISEYGRFDDLLILLGTPCEADAVEVIRSQLMRDLEAKDGDVSLLGKWLPSVNASSRQTVENARHLAKLLGYSEAQYRKILSSLRKRIAIIENSLRTRDYSFDYSKQPSKAMFKYREAFWRNDEERYAEFLDSVERGEAMLHTDTLMPYDVIAPCLRHNSCKDISQQQRKAMDVTWKALPDFTRDENALVVVDGSGSMYGYGSPVPAAVALSLGIYFAERNKGAFANHFITFSERPQLVEIKGRDIAEKVDYCSTFCEVANTNIERVFRLIFDTAVKNKLPEEELPSRIFIISDMEFDCCADNADETAFRSAKAAFAEAGYKLPEVVFWNVQSRNLQQPVTMNEQGVTLVSGCTPRLFDMVMDGSATPFSVMMETLSAERYSPISA